MKPPKKKKKIIVPEVINQLDVLEDRGKLREFCKQNNIKTPDFFVSEEFNKISQWAMKKNQFPLCLKIAKNYTDNYLIFILRAFRELPEFFDLIREKDSVSKVLIEEFLEGKAYLEVTLLDSKVRLISQISLNKTMELQQKWRAFPIKLPDIIYKKLEEIFSKFNLLLESIKEPLRFSFVIKNAEPILLSINSDKNRLEYLDEWRKQGGLEPLPESVYPNTSTYINKISIYKVKENTSIDLKKAIEVCEKSKVKYELTSNKLYFMLTSESSKDMAEDLEKANAIIKEILD